MFFVAAVKAAHMAITDPNCTVTDHWVGILPYFR